MWQCAIGPIFILSQAQLILTWGEKVEYLMMTFLDNLRVYNLSSTIFKMWGGLDPGLEISKQFFFLTLYSSLRLL